VAGWSASRLVDSTRTAARACPTSFTTGATFQEDRTNWSNYTNYSHELNLQSTGKRTVDWILGLYYAAEDNGIRFDIPIMNGTQQGTVAGRARSSSRRKRCDRRRLRPGDLEPSTTCTSPAASLHARRAQERRRQQQRLDYDPTVAAGADRSGPGSRPARLGLLAYQHNDGTFSATRRTWLARASYDLTGPHGYASVSTGYKSGGLQDGGRPYGAETLTNYEVGTKNTFMAAR
jgi:iron complex outermembrane receptor protein